ncbi:MAG: diguanylate cyclase [Anaerofustis sp.]
MELIKNIILIASCFLLVVLAIYTGKKLKSAGIPGLFAMIVFFLIWVIGNVIELNSSDFHWMLLGRNIEQIGVFFTPLCSLYFSIGYTSNKKLSVFAYLISIIQLISVILIFTDQSHHIMREVVAVQTNAFWGQSITVVSTKIGSALVAFNFCIPLIATVNLIAFMRTISAKLRRPLVLIVICIVATFVVSALQMTVLSGSGINIPIPVLDLPFLLLFAYAVLKGGFVGVAPTVLDKVFEVIDQGIIVVDENGTVVECNSRAAELLGDTGLSNGITIGSNILEHIPGAEDMQNVCFSADDLPIELKDRQNDRYVSLACHKLESSRHRLVGYVIVLTDITSLKVRAELDSLTGIYNREGMTNAFSELRNGSKNETGLSAMIIDLDNFKQINDTYGHFGGDVILMDLVGTVQTLIPGKFVLGRLGGDEFVVLVSMGLEQAVSLGENLRKRIAERTVSYLNHSMQYTVSIGVSDCTGTECELSDLLHRADIALYQAKHHGKNAVRA